MAKLESLKDLETPVAEAAAEVRKPKRDKFGRSYATGKRKDAREIEIEVESKITGNNEICREQFISFHNSNYTYELEVIYMGRTRIVKNCELKEAHCANKNIFEPLEGELTFLSADADLYADNASETDFLSVDPLWHVTRVYTQGGGTLAFGVINRSTEKVITYYGSEVAPIIATVTATGLVEGVNVSIGDVKVSVDCTLTEGDVFVLNSETRLITINGVKVAESKYNYNDLPNLLMQYGDNIVKITADDEGNIAFDANIEFVGRYGGL